MIKNQNKITNNNEQSENTNHYEYTDTATNI